ncbi:hypothetical protein [Rhizobium mesoamericanum]|uniref:Uncharacterized protein n=1 Tax=Rhizobium mesoamericanum STM3625 TaxID=1211777 RepID=K0PYR5_9HYPH|nr:hypothetical protein [Rhizobium mesoamericanum]CCM75119.1 hypothetical protein BN77_2282 [Rhizobium mesoamericanum STM3625]
MNRILRNGKDDVLFATKEAADAAARAELFRQMNSPIVVESFTGPTTKRAAAKKAGEAIFRKGKRIEIERKGAAA